MKQISKKREKGRHKASAHTEVCFLWVCVCLWIHSLPQSPNERPELPPSPSLQSLLHPSCSPPALLSLFITIWTIVCRLLSLSLSQCCSFSPLSLSLSLSLVQASCDFSRAVITFHLSPPCTSSLPYNSTQSVRLSSPMFSYRALFPVQPTSSCHIAPLTYDSPFLHVVQLIWSFWSTV